MNKRNYRKKKLEWFENNQKLREKEHRLSKIDSELYKMRVETDMKLINIRIMREKMEFTIDKFKANEMREERPPDATGKEELK